MQVPGRSLGFRDLLFLPLQQVGVFAPKSVQSFGPSRHSDAATMASADFCGRAAHVALTLHVPCPRHHRYCRLGDRTQTSPVNGNNFHPMRPLDLPVDLAVGLRHISQTHPVNRPCIQFLFVGSGLCRRLPSHKHSHACTCLELVVLPLAVPLPQWTFTT
jgi:hypothetical protein